MKYALTHKGWAAIQKFPNPDLSITQHAMLVLMDEDDDLYLDEKDISRNLEDVTSVPPEVVKKTITQLHKKKYIQTKLEDV